MSSIDRSVLAPIPGAVAGAAAYLLGYLVMYLGQTDRIRDVLEGLNTLLELFGGDPIPAWKAVGWLFYNAHFVSLTYPALGGGRVGRNVIASGNAPGLFYLLPPLLLLAAGAILARYAGATEAVDGALAGGSVAAGYAPLAIAGLFAFRVTIGDATVAPDLVTGVLLAGIVYPQIVGGIGGALATLAR